MAEGRKEALSYEELGSIADFVRQRISPYAPKLGIILGSGLGDLGDEIEQPVILNYSEIPSFPASTVPGHKGRLIAGRLAGKDVVCMQGRFHCYEGYPPWQVTCPVRVMSLLGVETLLVTNASGGLNERYKVGDLMLIKDHINLPGMAGGLNALLGPNEPRFGERFVPTSQAYDAELRARFARVAADQGLADCVHEGVYVFLAGPTFESIAEARMLRLLGADAVGMSTVPEVVVAVHCGLRVLGVSLVTNAVVTDYDTKHTANHLEVLETARQRGKDMVRLVTAFVKSL